MDLMDANFRWIRDNNAETILLTHVRKQGRLFGVPKSFQQSFEGIQMGKSYIHIQFVLDYVNVMIKGHQITFLLVFYWETLTV